METIRTIATSLLGGAKSHGEASWATAIMSLVVGVLAAGGALAGVLLTQRAERLRAEQDRVLQRRTTSATLRASLYESESQVLRAALAEHLTLTYAVDSGFRDALQSGRPWPGDKMDLVEREDRLYNQIQLLLDEGVPAHRALLEDISRLRDARSDVLWVTRRDAVVASATNALRGAVAQISADLAD
jgi:hypothetical protein